MSFEKAISKYESIVKIDDFIIYEKDFADKIISALSNRYLQDKNEVCLVHTIEDIVNKIKNFQTISKVFSISTKSIFIHGTKSHVKFNYYGQTTKPIELGDLIFISSVLYNNRKYFEKFTINQFKKDKKKTQSISWRIDNKKQLYLLSRFPAFEGVKGIVPKKKYHLSNYSGCLGSYGLLYRPGDFSFVSATRLDSYIGHNTSLKKTELYYMDDRALKFLYTRYPIFYPKALVLYFPPHNILGNCHFSSNVYDFIHEYLRMNVGELVFTKEGLSNLQAKRFLHELLSTIRIKAEKENDKAAINFIDDFLRVNYAYDERQNRFNENLDFDPEGGGIGIVHTTIDLGE